MTYLVFLIILINNSLFFSLIFNNKIENNCFISLVLIIVLCFIFGLFNNIFIGFLIYLLLSFLALIYNLYIFIKFPKKISKKINNISFVILIILYLFFIFVNYKRIIIDWDEFSHWGLVAKNMFYLNDFGLFSNSTVSAKSYMPGIGLLQYFILKLSGNYNEQYLYLAINCLYMSMTIPLFDSIKKKNVINFGLLLSIIILLPVLLFLDFYKSIYVDCILGITFFYSLYYYFTKDRNKLLLIDKINIILLFILMILIKDFGLILAFIYGTIILVDQLFIINQFKIKEYKKNVYIGLKVFLYALLGLILKIFWSVKLSLASITTNSGHSESIINGITNLFMWNIDDVQLSTLKNFIKSLFNTNLINDFPFNISFIFLILLLVFLGFLGSVIYKKEIRTIKLISISLCIGGFLYAFVLLICYLTILYGYEGLKLASFNRYIGIYSVSILFFIVFYLNYKIKNQNYQTIYLFLIVMILAACCSFDNMCNATIGARNSIYYTKIARNTYIESSQLIKDNIKDDDIIYFISCDSNGFDYWVFRYEITPIKIYNENNGWSLGKARNEDDVYSKNLSLEEWSNILYENCDYVYIYNADEIFRENYKLIFENNIVYEKSLYKVEKNNDNTVYLRLINRIDEIKGENND